MNTEKPRDPDGVSDAERSLLRKSVRDLLATLWPAEHAVERFADARAIATLWAAMARQGLAALGTNAAEVGLREIVLVFEELGRAACPAPLIGAVAANLALASPSSNARADEPGSGRVSGARTSKESPRWPLASLASAAFSVSAFIQASTCSAKRISVSSPPMSGSSSARRASPSNAAAS